MLACLSSLLHVCLSSVVAGCRLRWWAATSALGAAARATGSRTVRMLDAGAARAVAVAKVREPEILWPTHSRCSMLWFSSFGSNLSISTSSIDLFCYRCGEPGHVARDCERTEDGELDLLKSHRSLVYRLIHKWNIPHPLRWLGVGTSSAGTAYLSPMEAH